jgi:hypothetical protein
MTPAPSGRSFLPRPDDGQPDPGDITEAVALANVVNILGARFIDSTPGPDARTTAYINGRCTDCLTEPHSPGRPRCGECHAAHLHAIGGTSP